MARTVTVRLSVVVGVVLLVAGSGIYGFGAYDAAKTDRDAGIDVTPVSETTETVANFSTLPHSQQALFLLAVEPGQSSYYTTTDEQLQEVGSEMPYYIRYDGAIYKVTETHSDAIPGALPQLLGMVVTAIGGVVLLGAGTTSILRRIRD